MKSGNLQYRECLSKLTQNIVKEFLFLLIKHESEILRPSWTGFNKQHVQEEDLLPKSALHYVNVMDAPPNDMATISHVLQQSVENADMLDLDSVVVVFYQALYSKAQRIR